MYVQHAGLENFHPKSRAPSFSRKERKKWTTSRKKCDFHLKDPAHYDISHDERVAEYKRWLHENSFPNLIGQRGIFFDEDRKCHRPGIIIFPTWEELNTWWSDCWRRELWNDSNLPITFVSWRQLSPSIFRFDDDGSADVLSYDQAITVIRNRGRVEREPTPPPVLHPIFEGPIFRSGSFGETVQNSGGLNFIAGLHENGSIFDIRDYPLQTSASVPPTVIQGIKESLTDVIPKVTFTSTKPTGLPLSRSKPDGTLLRVRNSSRQN